ncbi:type VI secretion system baseplate subunit TssG [Biostraticola tofi]|uniref:Type VI secretion system protein ImpH n=1 Tax=Biostraticola tofi TaxID=466109 RepID=A0A4R3Z1P7_9GAMM|nr:type VI secretion system baseplate subunit TssG [Biostraticola tofi]TCV98827.1 type VI secretion system protein ImpH [Biostraticola tofi]
MNIYSLRPVAAQCLPTATLPYTDLRQPGAARPVHSNSLPELGAGQKQGTWPLNARAPWQYRLFPLLRRIDACQGSPYPLGCSRLPHHDPLRLGQSPFPGYTASEIAAIDPCHLSGLGRVTVYGFGLFGAEGPLPLHLTEHAWQRQKHHQDTALASFADIFHHRLISLFYRAWAASQLALSYDRIDTRSVDDCLASLLGMGQPALRPEGLNLHLCSYLAGHLSRRPRNAEGLKSILQQVFSVTVHVLENRFHWQAIPRRSQWRFRADQPAALGRDTCLGISTADYRQTFRLLIGPLDWNGYQRMLPGVYAGPPSPLSAAGLLQQWVHWYVGQELSCEVQLELDGKAYRGCRLDAGQPLGQACWLGHNPDGCARREVIYRLPSSPREPD